MQSSGNRFSSVIESWYLVNKRDLPWRETSNPYYIWLSEVILQQTRVDQGYAYYMRFVEQYPFVTDLAAAKEDDVLKLWQGLGYYSRARNLHAASRIIADKYKGEFPTEYKDILSLKGVGEYTAAAIASFAYNMPYAAIDGNVYRVLSRVFAIDEPIDSPKGKKIFRELADSLLDQQNPGLYNQSIMEFGALQCTPVNPGCTICPIGDMCLSYAADSVCHYPKKAGKQKTRNRYFNYIDIRSGEFMYLQKRTAKDIWQNLFELPLIESEKELDISDLQKDERFRSLFNNEESIKITPPICLKHVLSHQIIYASFYRIYIDRLIECPFTKILASDIDNYAVSRLVERYLENIP